MKSLTFLEELKKKHGNLEGAVTSPSSNTSMTTTNESSNNNVVSSFTTRITLIEGRMEEDDVMGEVMGEPKNTKFDVVLCDLPFGIQFGSEEENERWLYASFAKKLDQDFLTQEEHGRFALLTSVRQLDTLITALKEQGQESCGGGFIITACRKTPLGFTDAVIVLGKRRRRKKGEGEGTSIGPGEETSIDTSILSSRFDWEDAKAGRSGWLLAAANQRSNLVPAGLPL